jgi:putative CocE/NonD family hydrolase
MKSADVTIIRSQIRMRDGVQLSATVYKLGSHEPAPCVATITPYTADFVHERGMYFSTNGYPFVVVDTRGRGNSEGEFRPFVNDADDGHDVIEWLAQQPYCNGKVGMWGGSYGGYTQWMAAAKRPPHLVTIVPAASPYIGRDFPMRSNIFFPYILQWLTLTSGKALQARLFSDQAFWSALYRRWHESGRAFVDLDSLLGSPCATFQEWLQHPEPDEYWDARNPTAAEYAQLTLPMLTITGMYDDDQIGALEHYRRSIRHASPQHVSAHFLVIGPWDHAGTRTPKAEVGGVRFGPASLVDLPQLHLDWYGWTMAAGPRPAFLQKKVAYYITGAERWSYADTLDDVTESTELWYLDSHGSADDLYWSGQLQSHLGEGAPDRYRWDPREVSGSGVGAEADTGGASLTDQNLVDPLRGSALIYHSARFARDVEITGFFRLSLWISIDCPDTDIYVSVFEIAPGGGVIRLSTDAIRARYRRGLRLACPIEGTRPLEYVFESFTFVSREIARGSRLRLVVAPIGRLMESTVAERNFNGGGSVALESSNDARTVTVVVYHDRSHPSALQLPLGRGRTTQEPATDVIVPASRSDAGRPDY